MNVSKTIYEALLVEESYRQEVYLEEVIRHGCAQRHYYQTTGAPSTKRPQDLLLQRIEVKTRLLISRYLKGAYKKRFQEGSYYHRGEVLLLVDGYIDDRLVEIIPISAFDYDTSAPPRWAVFTAAAKAYYTGRKEALLVLMNRDGQEWMFWKITGDFLKATEDLRKDVAYINGMRESGKKEHISLASQMTCRHCPFVSTCATTPTNSDDPPDYSTKELRVVPALEERTEVEAYLWSINKEKKTGRKRKAIHPSTFSTSECDRQIAYELMGVEEEEKIDPHLRRIFDVGHCVHEVVQEILEAVISGFESEVAVDHRELRISGRCDGRLAPRTGLEIKSIGSKGFASLQKAKPEHEKQATIYGAILDYDQLDYLYVNKQDGEMAEFLVPINKTVWHKQATRAANVGKTVDAGQLPPQIDKAYICARCRFAWTCKPDTVADKQRSFR